MVAERTVYDWGGWSLWLFFIEVLDSRELGLSDVLGRSHNPLYRLVVGYRAVSILRGDAASQDALNGAAVELSEDPCRIFSAS